MPESPTPVPTTAPTTAPTTKLATTVAARVGEVAATAGGSAASPGVVPGQTKAECPVIDRPTTRVLIWRVPSKEYSASASAKNFATP